VRVTLDIPSNVQRGNYPLTVSVENTSGATANDAATVTVQDCPVQPIVCNYGDSSGNVPLVGLQNAIDDFVQNNINLSELQAVIDDFINS